MQQTNQKKQTLKEFQVHLHDIAKAEWLKVQGENPELSNWTIKLDSHCYRKRPPGFHKVIEEIMKIITTPQSRNPMYAHVPAGADRTQAEILRQIRPNFATHNIQPNVWNRILTRKQLERLKQLAGSNFRKPIDIAGCKTLAQAKKCIQAALHAGDASFSFKGIITIDDDALVIGKETYPIEKRKASGHEYPSIRVNVNGKRQWLRVDTLRSILPCKMIKSEKNANEKTVKSA